MSSPNEAACGPLGQQGLEGLPVPPGRPNTPGVTNTVYSRHLGAYDHGPQGISDVSDFCRVIVSMFWSRDGDVGRVAGYLPQRNHVSAQQGE